MKRRKSPIQPRFNARSCTPCMSPLMYEWDEADGIYTMEASCIWGPKWNFWISVYTVRWERWSTLPIRDSKNCGKVGTHGADLQPETRGTSKSEQHGRMLISAFYRAGRTMNRVGILLVEPSVMYDYREYSERNMLSKRTVFYMNVLFFGLRSI